MVRLPEKEIEKEHKTGNTHADKSTVVLDRKHEMHYSKATKLMEMDGTDAWWDILLQVNCFFNALF